MRKQEQNLSSIVALFLGAAQSKRFSDELNKSIIDGNVTYPEKTHYFAKDISSAGGTIQLLDENTKKTAGSSSISEGRLAKNEGAVSVGVEFLYGTGDASKPGSVDYNTAMPAVLQNAVITLSQNGRVLLSRPVSDAFAKGTATGHAEKVLELRVPIAIRDAEAIKAELEFPTGTSMPAEISATEQHMFLTKIYTNVTQRKA
ncbi:hypothetical protein [Croceibacter atlanticus]|uniref:hypothetical protein n=1 Tax=Croceibacter atlanticus TaxID=313588 RepID=UPI0030F88A85